MKKSTKDNKKNFPILSIALISLLLASTAQAQYGDNREENRRIQERKDLHAENMEKYPYNEHTEGLSLVSDSPGVQKCLRWVSWVPVYHRDRSPYIEHALYDIAIMGEQMLEYQQLENEEKMMRQSFFDDVQEKIRDGRRATDFCDKLESVPNSFNPRRQQGN